MLIGSIVKEKQPEIHRIISERSERKRRYKENLSFSDVESLMRHDSYSRHKGAIKQVNHG